MDRMADGMKDLWEYRIYQKPHRIGLVYEEELHSCKKVLNFILSLSHLYDFKLKLHSVKKHPILHGDYKTKGWWNPPKGEYFQDQSVLDTTHLKGIQ